MQATPILPQLAVRQRDGSPPTAVTYTVRLLKRLALVAEAHHARELQRGEQRKITITLYPG